MGKSTLAPTRTLKKQDESSPAGDDSWQVKVQKAKEARESGKAMRKGKPSTFTVVRSGRWVTK